MWKKKLQTLAADRFKHLEIEARTEFFVAEVKQFKITSYVRDEIIHEIIKALDLFGVLIIRDQVLPESLQLQFAKKIGRKLHNKTGISAITGKSFGKEPLTHVSNVGANNQTIKVNDRRRLYGLANRLWHTDASFQNPPGRYSLLYAEKSVHSGGETEFADTRAAYYALSKEKKHFLSNLKVHHSIVHSREVLGFKFSKNEAAKLPGEFHPMIRTNERTNLSSLYLASHCSEVSGMTIPDGRILLFNLIEHSTNFRRVYKHRWSVNDFVIWDNFATMHRGLEYNDLNEQRIMRRVTTLNSR